ncbi:hypothetical protein AZE42_11980 [Rhizopogon vesiculosus]|uniref:Uncharacterized protein n=1 Tax=Rhizopogon vesiculosus TaxID=180088 RepID=A0A1J8QYR0_9AGAM|nr:hypothetical protein AZE42_11980 [Rhizopogon vesiculosus]
MKRASRRNISKGLILCFSMLSKTDSNCPIDKTLVSKVVKGYILQIIAKQNLRIGSL